MVHYWDVFGKCWGVVGPVVVGFGFLPIGQGLARGFGHEVVRGSGAGESWYWDGLGVVNWVDCGCEIH